MVKKKKFNVNDIPEPDVRRAMRDFANMPTSHRKVRAYFDANIAMSVAERVRKKLKWDVLSIQEQPDLRNRDDEFHYKNARKLGRIIFTLDKDFLDDRRFPLHESPGVVVVDAKPDDIDDIFHGISVASKTLTESYQKVPDFHLKIKAYLNLEGLRLRYITYDSKVHEIFSPH
jgi:predicted nuclease of predicted toxin-antitoxin system